MTIKRVELAVELADGRSWDRLVINNHAMVAFDFERTDKKWPSAQDAPFLWLTFLAWQQLVDQGEYDATVTDPAVRGGRPASSFPRFRDTDCTGVDEVSKGKREDVDPTLTDHEPSSASP